MPGTLREAAQHSRPRPCDTPRLLVLPFLQDWGKDRMPGSRQSAPVVRRACRQRRMFL